MPEEHEVKNGLKKNVQFKIIVLQKKINLCQVLHLKDSVLCSDSLFMS